jgi:hypothetical protein
MKCMSIVGACAVSFILDFSSAALAASPQAPSLADRLVTQALEADLDGDPAQRQKLLAAALVADPDSPSARWNNGFVKHDGAWRSLSEVEELVAQDRRRDEYEALRREMSDDPESHFEMAQWCDDRGLRAQARFHWLKVLWDDPTRGDARRALDLYEYGDGLYTKEQIVAMKAEAAQAEDDFQKFRRQYDKLLREAVRDESSRTAVLAKFAAVDDPAAIDALEYVVMAHSARGPLDRLPKETAQEFRRDLAFAFISALAGMPEHKATLRLAEYAIDSKSPEVRHRAAVALKPRQSTDYVPLWMGALTAPIEVSIDVVPTVDGLMMTETARQAGTDVNLQRSRTTSFDTVRKNPDTTAWRDFTGTHVANATRLASETQMRAAAANAEGSAVNERIIAALRVTTGGLELGPNPQVWWQAWEGYNELYREERPIDDVVVSQEVTIETMSCFISGTPVWTDGGLKNIEQIVPGDLVLSQNPETGELAFRSVLRTTIRPPTKLVSLKAGKDMIVATRGHRFWVDNQGWEMAKFLKTGMHLHTVEGGVELTEVGDFEGEELEAYNLVVEGFHTYFVGHAKLLVGDNSCPAPTLAVTPGFVRAKQPRASLGDEAATITLPAP